MLALMIGGGGAVAANHQAVQKLSGRYCSRSQLLLTGEDAGESARSFGEQVIRLLLSFAFKL